MTCSPSAESLTHEQSASDVSNPLVFIVDTILQSSRMLAIVSAAMNTRTAIGDNSGNTTADTITSTTQYATISTSNKSVEQY